MVRIVILEARMNMLFHVTKIDNLDSILESDTLYKSKSRNKSIKPDGVSFTRDINFTKQYLKDSIVLVFDKEKIACNYKLQPVTDHPNGLRSRTRGNSKAEEVLVDRDLRDVHKYLDKIIVYYDTLNVDILKKLEAIHKKYPNIEFELR